MRPKLCKDQYIDFDWIFNLNLANCEHFFVKINETFRNESLKLEVSSKWSKLENPLGRNLDISVGC